MTLMRNGHAPEHEHEYNELRGVRVETLRVTVVTFPRGTGCCPESPYRMVTAYYDADGKLLFEVDGNGMDRA